MSTKFLRQIPALLGMDYVYVLSDLKFRNLGFEPHVWKVGITSQGVSERKANIETSIYHQTGQKVALSTVIALPIWGAKHVETAAHRAFDRFRSDVYSSTSGGTEWFAWRNWICAVFVAMIGFANAQPVSHCIGFGLLFAIVSVPFDAILCVLLLWLIQMSIALSAAWGAISFLALCGRIIFHMNF